MSRFVVFSIPAWGHTNPTVEVVRQLTARGHQVRYYTFEDFREKLEVCRELEEFAPDLIVADSVCFWGKLLAKKLGIPMVCSTTTFAFNQHTGSLLQPKGCEFVRMVLGLPRIGRKMKQLREHGYPVNHFLELLQNDNAARTIVYLAWCDQ